MKILTVTSVSIFVPLENQIELQNHYSGVDHQLPHSPSEPGLSTSYSEIRSSKFRQSKRSLWASFGIDSILLWNRGNGVIIMSSAARSDLKINTFPSSIFEYLRKLICKARRCINSKIEGAKMICTLLGSSIDEIDTQIWLAERLGLVDVTELTGFFLQYEYASLGNPKPGKTKLAINIREQIYNYWKVNSEMSIHSIRQQW